MKIAITVFVFCAVLFSHIAAYASVPIVDTVLGESIDVILIIAGKSSLKNFKQYLETK